MTLRARLGATSPYRRQVVLTSAMSMALYGAGLVTGPLTARALGPAGRGELAAVIATSFVVSWVVSFGIPLAAAYHVDEIPEDRLLASTTFFGALATAPVCAALWFAAPHWFASYSSLTVTWVRIALAAIPLSVGTQAALEVLRRRHPGAAWNFWRTSPVLVPAVAIVGLAVAGRLTLTSALVANAAGNLFPFLYLASRIARRPALPRWSVMRAVTPYALRSAPALWALSSTALLDQVILGGTVPAAELGLYAVAVTAGYATGPLSSGISLVLFGHLRGEADEAVAARRFRRSLLACLAASSAVAALMAVTAPLLLRFAFGAAFQAAATPLRILLVGMVARDLAGIVASRVQAEGRPAETSKAALLGATITIAGMAAVVPRYGINGAAAVTSCDFVAQLAFLAARGNLGTAPRRAPRRARTGPRRRPPEQRLRRLARRAAVASAFGLLALAVGVASVSPLLVRAGLALAVVAVLATAALLSPRPAVIAALGWLVVLGTVRRVLLHGGAAGTNDPLLLVQPAVVVVLVAIAAARGAFRRLHGLGKPVLWFTLLLGLSALNPLQGNLQVGLAGLLFVLVPILWFWVGVTLLDDRLFRGVLGLAAAAAPLAALYGLYQVYVRFPSWDAAWVQSRGYDALRVGDSLRQFAMFTSAAEYVSFISIGLLVWYLCLRDRRFAVPGVLAMGVISWALLLASVRGALVILALSVGVLWAAWRGFGAVRAVVWAVGGLLVLGVLVGHLPANFGGHKGGALVNRTVTGLADPFDPSSSTLPVHITAAVDGLVQAVKHPLGRGAGAASIASDRFGEAAAVTDLDVSNVAITTGLAGVVLYLWIVAGGVATAYRRARTHRDLLSLAALAILVATGLQWLNGGQYAVAPLPWLALGWLVRRERDERDDRAAPPGDDWIDAAPDGPAELVGVGTHG